MKKRWIWAATLLICLIPVTALALDLPHARGDTGVQIIRMQLRLRDLGYIPFRATGKYGDMTFNGVLRFQKNNGLDADGITGESVWSILFNSDVKRVSSNSIIPRVFGPGETNKVKTEAQLSSWSEIDRVFPVKATATLTDSRTSKSYQIVRTGGVNHADVEPATEADAAVWKETFGGGYSWEKRPCIVAIEGVSYAASLFGMPNATDTIRANGLSGAICLFFNDSRSDVGALPDAEHAANVQEAAAQ